MSKIHVLVVEDEPTLARIIKDALEANDSRFPWPPMVQPDWKRLPGWHRTSWWQTL